MLAWQIATAPLFLIIVPGSVGNHRTPWSLPALGSRGKIYRKANIWICFEILWLCDEIWRYLHMIWTYLAVKTDVFWRCSYQHPGMADPMTEDPMLQAWLGPCSNGIRCGHETLVDTKCLVRSQGGFPPLCKVTWRGLRQSLQVCGAKML